MKRKLVLLGVALGAFFMGYGALALAYPSPAPFGRAEYHGYYQDQPDSDGTFVLDDIYSAGAAGFVAIPSSVNSAATFNAFIKGKLSGSTWDKTGASFIIDTMLGLAPSMSNYTESPAGAHYNSWASLVTQYDAAGLINWNVVSQSYTLNTFYQHGRSGPGPTDDAWFDDSGSDPAIVFSIPGGGHYMIRRQCGNPIGYPTPLKALATWNMNGAASLPASQMNPKPGDTITFTYYLKDLGPDNTAPTTINWEARNPLNAASPIIASGNAGTFTDQQQELEHTENYKVPSLAPGTKICREMYWFPDTQAGGSGVSPQVCAIVAYDFGLNPNVTPTVTDASGAVVPSNVAEPGGGIKFTYSVNNSGTTISQSATCTIYGVTKPGYYTAPTPNDTSGPPLGVPTGCPRTFPVGNTTLSTVEPIPAASIVANTTICRTLVVSPSTFGGGPKSYESCVLIAAKPYLRVYGGDVSAGDGFNSGQADNCSLNNAAAIVSWNREAAPAPARYAAAGVQYAAQAMNTIFDFSTTLGNAAGAAAPSSLAFANIGRPSGGNFGGSYGAVPCATDYYGTQPGGTPTGNAINLGSAALTTGVYTTSGATTIGGTFNTNKQVAVYVNGDVHITSDIVYPASWTMGTTPLLELIVKGNIYVNRGVHQIAGLYVAQPTGAAGGVIYTCDNNPDGTLYGNCNSKLTINGAFVAGEVDFLRTFGTQGQATSAETAAGGQGAEVFNYSPALWMATPPGQSTNNNYDAITSLPPIL
ncbi:MAG TPA: hypothetical protein VLF91_01230 [Candidatus Saccharimonadales bacterium]|nr:hypothetical protein [Candidatus Saccharimonadales bacterium]